MACDSLTLFGKLSMGTLLREKISGHQRGVFFWRQFVMELGIKIRCAHKKIAILNLQWNPELIRIGSGL
jgi:hypothetical protein